MDEVSPTVIAARVVEAILAQKLAPGERLGEQALAQGVGCAFDLCTAETHAGAGQGDGIRVEPVLVLPQAHYVLGLDRRFALVALVLNGQFEQPPFGLMAHRFGQ